MSARIDKLIADLRADRVEPHWDGIDGRIPWCIEECSSHDGKRCKRTGHKPDGICKPAVRALVQIVARL